MMEARGTAAIRKALTGMLAAVTVTDMRIDATYATTGDTSVGWGHFYMTVTPKGGGAPQKMEGRATVVAKRIGGKWLYVTDHASVPLPPPPAAPSR
jgi:ketosteroid isomerase-like protein